MDTKIIENLIQEEMERATKKISPFNSPHEGYAIIQEEIDELDQEFLSLHNRQDELWSDIKSNWVGGQLDKAESLHFYAIQIIKEAIQVGAMAKRFLKDIKIIQ